MKLLGLILLFFYISGNEASALGPLSCRSLLFDRHHDEQTLLEILKIQDTDRVVLFEARPKMSVTAFIDEIIVKKREQLELFRLHEWTSVPVFVRDHYGALFEASVKGTIRSILRLHEFPGFAHLTLDQMINPEPRLEPLRSALVSFMVQSNTVLAEFFAALHFPQVIQTESSIAGLIAPYENSVYAPLRYALGDESWAHFLNRKMDVISRDAQTFFWIEVKYLGRSKRYTAVSGDDVYTKLKSTKELAELLPTPIRVILVVAGPGWLSEDAIRRYEDIGVEVVSLTPNW